MEEIQFNIFTTLLGFALAAKSEKGLCAVLFGDSPEELIESLHKEFSTASFRQIEAQREPLFSPVSRSQRPLLDMRGTPFQLLVWSCLCEIPIGSTMSYSAIAQKIGHPTSARAVARACAANRLAILVPCHRVIRADGSISGYRWGAERKRMLLELENASTHSALHPLPS